MSAHRRVLVAAFVCVLLPPSIAHAQTTQTFTVAATVVPGCLVQTVGGGEWGRIDLGTVAGTATGPVEAELLGAGIGLAIECTPGTTVSVGVDTGQHASGGTRMLAPASGTARVPYRLILEGGAEWTSQTVALAFDGTQPVRRLPLRGRATLAGMLPAGRYTDTVRVTLSW